MFDSLMILKATLGISGVSQNKFRGGGRRGRGGIFKLKIIIILLSNASLGCFFFAGGMFAVKVRV